MLEDIRDHEGSKSMENLKSGEQLEGGPEAVTVRQDQSPYAVFGGGRTDALICVKQWWEPRGQMAWVCSGNNPNPAQVYNIEAFGPKHSFPEGLRKYLMLVVGAMSGCSRSF